MQIRALSEIKVYFVFSRVCLGAWQNLRFLIFMHNTVQSFSEAYHLCLINSLCTSHTASIYTLNNQKPLTVVRENPITECFSCRTILAKLSTLNYLMDPWRTLFLPLICSLYCIRTQLIHSTFLHLQMVLQYIEPYIRVFYYQREFPQGRTILQ